MIGIYKDPPPEGQDSIKAFTIDSVAGWDSVVQRQFLNVAVEISKAKDWLHNLVSS